MAFSVVLGVAGCHGGSGLGSPVAQSQPLVGLEPGLRADRGLRGDRAVVVRARSPPPAGCVAGSGDRGVWRRGAGLPGAAGARRRWGRSAALAGRDDARRAGGRRAQRRWHGRDLRGHPVRPAPCGGTAVAGAAAARAAHRGAVRGPVLGRARPKHLHVRHPRPVAGRRRAAGEHAPEPVSGQRRQPLPERLAGYGTYVGQAAGAGVHTRWRLRHGVGRSAAVRRRGAGLQRSGHRGHDQLPAGCARIPLPSGAGR